MCWLKEFEEGRVDTLYTLRDELYCVCVYVVCVYTYANLRRCVCISVWVREHRDCVCVAGIGINPYLGTAVPLQLKHHTHFSTLCVWTDSHPPTPQHPHTLQNHLSARAACSLSWFSAFQHILLYRLIIAYVCFLFLFCFFSSPNCFYQISAENLLFNLRLWGFSQIHGFLLPAD